MAHGGISHAARQPGERVALGARWRPFLLGSVPPSQSGQRSPWGHGWGQGFLSFLLGRLGQVSFRRIPHSPLPCPTPTHLLGLG